MIYREYEPPAALRAAVKVAWTLSVPDSDQSPSHQALPDGCIEVIRRWQGQSFWLRPQPAQFVVGLIDRPALLRFSPGARFCGIRLWPWSWAWLVGQPLALRNDWAELSETDLDERSRTVLASPWCDQWQALQQLFLGQCRSRDLAMAEAALDSRSTAQMAATAGVSSRSCQRWLVQHAGITPRTFRRLLRFEQMWRGLQSSSQPLVDQALAAGYADQPHMAREFRRYARQPAQRLLGRLRGPFADS